MFELWMNFERFEQWKNWQIKHPWIFNESVIPGIVDKIKEDGIVDIDGSIVDSSKIEISTNNYRETINYNGLNSRLRAVKLLIDHHLSGGPSSPYIYVPESTTPFAKYIRKNYSNFTGREYLTGTQYKEKYQNIQYEDVMDLSFDDRSFDLYISCEIVEHVPDIGRMLKEARRILNLGGAFIATFPFAISQYDHIVQTTAVNGEFSIQMPQKYLGTPSNNRNDSSIYTIPGWKILDECQAYGFDRAFIVFIGSARHGVIGADIPFVSLLYAIN